MSAYCRGVLNTLLCLWCCSAFLGPGARQGRRRRTFYEPVNSDPDV